VIGKPALPRSLSRAASRLTGRSHSPRARLVDVGGAFARAPGRIGGYGVEFAVNRAKLSDEVLDDFGGREVPTGDAACFARGHIAHLPLPPE